MKIKEQSVTLHTDRIKECVDFYCKYLQASVVFEAEWYVMLRFAGDGSVPIYLSFQGSNGELPREAFAGGVTLNLMVEDVDACYASLKETGIAFVEDISDHEWGDRSFSVQDPIGSILYIYSERPIGEKYQSALKE